MTEKWGRTESHCSHFRDYRVKMVVNSSEVNRWRTKKVPTNVNFEKQGWHISFETEGTFQTGWVSSPPSSLLPRRVLPLTIPVPTGTFVCQEESLTCRVTWSKDPTTCLVSDGVEFSGCHKQFTDPLRSMNCLLESYTSWINPLFVFFWVCFPYPQFTRNPMNWPLPKDECARIPLSVSYSPQPY